VLATTSTPALRPSGVPGPEVVLECEEKRQAGELRRQCDRMRLEAALGFDET